MKLKIKPYLRFLLKQNLVYFILLGVLFILSATIVPYFISQISQAIKDLDKAKAETNLLQVKKRVLQAVVNEHGSDIDSDLTLINRLIPDSEDYFTMIYSLEKLTASSGFIINSYAVNLTKSTGNKLSLTVTGLGDSESFLELLRIYNFGGGRLITAEKIGIDPSQQNGITLELNFYNEKVKLDANDKQDFQASINELNELRSKVKFSLVEENDLINLSEDESYPTKTSLF